MRMVLGKSVAYCLAYLFLFSLTVPARAWPPPCPDCYYWNGYDCEYEGDCVDWTDCGDWDNCCDCVDCWCEDNDYWCDECYKCSGCNCVCDITVNSVSSNKDTACVGCDITFTASVTGSCSCVDWSGGGDPATASDTCTFITHWDSPGTKTVTATPDCGSSKSKNVNIFADPIAVLEYAPVKTIGRIGRGETVYFDGQGSFDPDGGNGSLLNGIKKFEWDWDNDGTYDYEENPGDGRASHAFNTGGTKTVTLRVTDNDAAEGCSPDRTATDSVTFDVCSAAHVEDFHKVHCYRPEPGVLLFRYGWSSTSGTLSDLDGLVGEIVEYPGSADPYIWPSPPWNCGTPNPTTRSSDASTGEGWDEHGTGTFIKPYQAASFSASQEYGFHCNQCMPAGEGVLLLGPHSIDRQVYWVGPPASTWRYRIEKTGESAEKDLP
ncbi:MAG: PKD domain-containing protein [Sedimentisphaerales bacterium]